MFENWLKRNELQLKEYNLQLEKLVKERTNDLDDAMDQLKMSNEELQATNEELYLQKEQLTDTLERLRETQEQLVNTEKMASLGVLTAGVAHEINNPINYIYNGTLAIENYLAENCPEHLTRLKPFFEAVNTGINRTIAIVRSLNKYSRNENDRFIKCSIHEIIDNCLTMLYNQYKNRIEIVKEYAENMPEINASEGKLHQVFTNVLVNAVLSIEDEGRITIITSMSDDKACIRIIDTGTGIMPEIIKKIYDPFYTTRDPGKGTGLGLSITLSIIKEHKGTIQCKSRPGHGTEFIINLPVA